MTDHSATESDIEEFAMNIGLLLRRIRADAPEELQEFSWTQKAVLSRLEKDGPQTSADLARAEGVKPQSMGTAISSLQELGLVERVPHPTDGRQFNVKLSSKGISLRKRTRDAKHSWLTNAIASLDKKDQSTLFKANAVIAKMVERTTKPERK